MTARLVEGRKLGWNAGRAAAAWLRETRETAGPRRQDLADRLGISVTWLWTRESESTRMSAEEVRWIAETLGVPVPELPGEGPS